MADSKVTAAAVIKKARSYLGYHETGGAHDDGNLTMFGAWYGLNANPWCAMFVSYVLSAVGMRWGVKGSKGFAYCPSAVDWCRSTAAKKLGWKMLDKPAPGAIVFYVFGPPVPGHVGFCETALHANGTFLTVEGNTSPASDANGGEVMERTRVMADVYAITMPPYSASHKNHLIAVLRTKGGNGERILGLTSPLTAGSDVKKVQRKLIALKFLDAKIAGKSQVDGQYGKQTAAAVRRFQAKHGLVVDGQVGPKTHHALFG